MKKLLLFFSYIFLYNSTTQAYLATLSEGILQACYSVCSTIGTKKVYSTFAQQPVPTIRENNINPELIKLEKITYTGSLITDAASWTALWYKTRQICVGDKKKQAVVLGTGLLISLGIHTMGKSMIKLGTFLQQKKHNFSLK